MLEESKDKDTLFLSLNDIPDNLGSYGDDDAIMDYFLQDKFTPCQYFASG